MGGTFDPPTFWYDLDAEVFVRSKAHFVGDIEAVEPRGNIFLAMTQNVLKARDWKAQK